MKTKTRALSFAVLVAILVVPSINGTANGTQASGAANRLPSWIDEEKVRAGYVYINDDPKYAALMSSKGLNTLLVKGEFQHKRYFEKTLTKYREWGQAAKQLKLHTFLAYNLQADPNSFSYRRAVYSDGTTDIAPCLRDDSYWDDYLTRLGKAIAELSLAQDVQVDGLLLDCELYGNAPRKQNYSEACYCDNCFSSYLLANNYSGEQLPPVGPDGRKRWLETNKLLNGYLDFLKRDVESRARKLEVELHKINPNLVIGMYPTPADWARTGLARGLGTQESPVLIFATDSYYKGGHKSIPDNPTRRYEASGINAVYVAGYLFRRYGSDELEENMYEAARKCNGYWLFRMRMLWGRSEEGESLTGGSEEDYWKAISRANARIDTMIVEKRTIK
jgi:hypothetical protein